jgi:hypothetical protein
MAYLASSVHLPDAYMYRMRRFVQPKTTAACGGVLAGRPVRSLDVILELGAAVGDRRIADQDLTDRI